MQSIQKSKIYTSLPQGPATVERHLRRLGRISIVYDGHGSVKQDDGLTRGIKTFYSYTISLLTQQTIEKLLYLFHSFFATQKKIWQKQVLRRMKAVVNPSLAPSENPKRKNTISGHCHLVTNIPRQACTESMAAHRFQ